MPDVTPVEAIYVTTTTGIEAITTNDNLFFQKLWLYPAKAVAAGVLTANTGSIYVGKSATYLPDVLAVGDLPLKIELPLGQKMKLALIRIKGAIGDGVFYSYT